MYKTLTFSFVVKNDITEEQKTAIANKIFTEVFDDSGVCGMFPVAISKSEVRESTQEEIKDYKYITGTGVIDNYEHGLCPDCSEEIPKNATVGEECSNCGHVWSHDKLND
jgi:adenine-specific DNA methylase